MIVKKMLEKEFSLFDPQRLVGTVEQDTTAFKENKPGDGEKPPIDPNVKQEPPKVVVDPNNPPT